MAADCVPGFGTDLKSADGKGMPEIDEAGASEPWCPRNLGGREDVVKRLGDHRP
jgi:hypothetical protein